MNVPSDPARDALRRQIMALLIVLSVGALVGRILAVNAVDRIALESHLYRQGRPDWPQQRPFLSGNDRSRWCTIRALVEQGTYAIDDIHVQRGWDTIDMVYHDGHYYSSKPPLLPTLLAGPYWLIHRTTGASLATHPFEIGRGLLLLYNVVPLVLYFLLIARLVDRFGLTDWGRLFVVACATLGTFLTTFAVVLNNHLFAAVSVLGATYLAIRIVYDGERRLRYFAGCGLLAAFTAANELPALAFLALLTLALLYRATRETLLGYLPAVLVVAAAFFGTNFAAHGTFVPPYAQRAEGENWYDYTYERDGKLRESYWNNRVGIDRGEPSPARYAFHVLVGHHGIFSLTPIWFLTLAGLALHATRRELPLRELAWFVAILSAVCLAFYLSRPLIDRNYGGMTAGFRWMFWFAPLWLLVMLPAADACAGRRWARALALALLAVSVLSASYPTWNPWSHPWLTNLMLHLGGLRF